MEKRSEVSLEIIKGGITSPKGFYATAGQAGIKQGKKDLALVYSELPAETVGVFTKNVVKGAHVLWCQELIKKKCKIQAIIINSGNANTCTGELGFKHTDDIATELASCLGLIKEQVLVASTGIIGVPLPINNIIKGIRKIHRTLGNTEEHASMAAEAIMTTDTKLKQVALETFINGFKIRIGGMAKGSGMIHPNMATMLSFITTDVNISRELLHEALVDSVEDTYNMISVDGDTSTNDSVFILANGMSGNPKIDKRGEVFQCFKQAIHYINTILAQEIVKDGEGANKFIIAHVKGAFSKSDAQKLSRAIVTSNLVKAAIFGEDANWGRIVSAMGNAGVNFNPLKVTINLLDGDSSITLMQEGLPVQFDELLASNFLKKKEICIEILLKEGEAEAIAWGCDLSYEYVRINADYRT